MPRLGAVGILTATLAWAACGPGGEADSDASTASAAGDRLNPMIALHEAGQPVFGLYAPGPGGGPARGGALPPPPKDAATRAGETLEFGASDFVFDGSMERGVDAGLPTFAALAGALGESGVTARTHPLVVKMAKITGPDQAAREVALQLDLGVSGIMFVEVESVDEVLTGLAAMRWESEGGWRPDRVGSAPVYWGVDEDEYRAKAGVWPLDPQGELIAWVVVESLEGLANVREIAAVPGIGVLWPGAGTLRGVFTTEVDGERVFDEEGWEDAIQTVLAACKEFDVPCGYPANSENIEQRMRQGFEVFVMGWGDDGFTTVLKGRSAARR